MTSATQDQAITTPMLLMAIEVSEGKWDVGYSRGGEKVRRRTLMAWDKGAFQYELRLAKQRLKLDEKVEVRCCYEAGRVGFCLHRYLESLGIQNEVMESSSIEVSRQAKHAKTDGLDVKKMVGMMTRKHIYRERKVFKSVCVPSREDEDEMRLHRERGRLKKERTAHCARIRSLLALHGIRVSSLKDFVASKVVDWEGKALPKKLEEELAREAERLRLVEDQIKKLEDQQEEALKAPKTRSDRIAAKLKRMRGVGIQSAWLLSKELFGWRTFRNRKQVGGISGLVDVHYDSGGSHRQQGISKAGNKRLRWVLVELAWSWLRYEPDSTLSRWYWERWGHGNSRQRRIGIVALARKLLVALWKYVERDEVPKGAMLTKA